ncbi:MAG: ATP-dependent DNA helicase RecG [Parcubacteria group bacterium GW2011_GWC1_43_12]|nr:MAG: ATP-dependent DNA helicase [Parcubacteria group bacterium GW2011_GWB1_42_6]KKS92345.1 MAG: ATP-dependent DNA helicase RecG [Parcubacteria group bacterium GW2011_GWC1_43_12]
MYSLSSPIQSVSRVAPAYQKRLLKLGIKNVRDLLYHFPFRYDDFSKIISIVDLKLNETATIQGEVTEIENIKTWKKKMTVTQAFVCDKTGMIKAVWFNQPYLIDQIKEGSRISLSGKIAFDGVLFISNPAYERLPPAADRQTMDNESRTTSDKRFAIRDLRHTGRIVPIYPETSGITSRYLRYIIQIILSSCFIEDWLPQEIKKSKNLPDLNEAIKKIHFPDSFQEISRAKRRLGFDELFSIQLVSVRQKFQWQKQRAPGIEFNQPLIKNFVDGLPFKLTDAQRTAAWEILNDISKTVPMNRLLEGDVGSGKTVVAAIAALQTAFDGKQAAFMAPTEILARQHFETIKHFFSNQDLPIAFLAGSDCQTNLPRHFGKKEIIEKIKKGEIKIIAGTQALIQKKVEFKNLALAIVDEQHRFGVAQRASLQNNISRIKDDSPKEIPHLLSMTATPIPRTLALAIYGDLDISRLNQVPKDRKEIITKIVKPAERQKSYEFIRQQIKQSRQAFVICPRIENESNKETGAQIFSDKRKTAWLETKAAEEEYKKLSKEIFPDLKIGLLHGRLKPAQKQKIMKEFSAGSIDILVSTSVIEIGIDVPNASVMMIEGADRFGLAQLHQFRGRVGRGKHQSYCLLFSQSNSKDSALRLRALLETKTGFDLAEKDLLLRGPGDFIGTRQSGLPDLSMASLTDFELVRQAKNEATAILSKDPELKKYPLLAEKLSKFKEIIHLE